MSRFMDLAPHRYPRAYLMLHSMVGVTRIEILKMWCALWVGVWLTVGYREYVNHYTPSVISLQTERMTAVVYGDEVVLHLVQFMPRNSCVGGITTRRLIRLWGTDHPAGISPDDPRDIAFFKEHDVPWTRKGKHDFSLHLHLQGPVRGQGWIFEFERYDNCSWFDDFFPNTPISPAGLNVINSDAHAPPETP